MSQNNNHNGKDVLFVGLGASSGGLKPLQEFFKSLPKETGMAFIVVLHLSPNKRSKLTEILQMKTSMKVIKVQERTLIETDHVYVIPPNKFLSVEKDYLELSDSNKKHSIASIDQLFTTLALTKQKYSAGIIISGSGSDGVAGMNMIKKEGGFTMAMNPDDANHSSMPTGVILTGVVDIVLPIKNMARELMEYRDTLHQIRISEEAEELSKELKTGKIISKIFKKLKDRNNHEFRNYRRSTVLRRIDRRMRITRIHSLIGYLEYLNKNPEEIDNLYKDLLISVTSFFRDPEAFKVLEEKALPKLFEIKEDDEQIRIWVVGCATGEEAYSIAIMVNEYASTLNKWPDIKIIASDTDQKAVVIARKGRYSKFIKNSISKERLDRFFIETDDEFIVKENLREMILFATHNVLYNPPFSRLDMVTCRNLLIYLNKVLQPKVLNMFHYALRNEGFLFLGMTDNGIDMGDLFTPVSEKSQIYRQKPATTSRISLPSLPLLTNDISVSTYQKDTPNKKDNMEKMHWDILNQVYTPQSVLISNDYEVIHATNGMNKFLQFSVSKPDRNILKMVNPKIRQHLRNVLFQLNNEVARTAHKVWVKTDDEFNNLELIARRFKNKDFPEGLIHVIFESIPEVKISKHTQKKYGKNWPEEATNKINSIKKELEYTLEQHQLLFENYEASHEEMRSSNSDQKSVNEELLATTEELKTSQEQLLTAYEELKTINDQLDKNFEELSRAYSDLENLMEATEIGIIFVNRNLCVQRFTGATTDIFNFIASDKGRPLKDVTHSLKYEEFFVDINEVLNTSEEIKKVISTIDERWFVVRIRPYFSTKKKTDGVVISFTEFTELKEARDINKNQKLHKTLATLSVYALEQSDLEMILHRTIQLFCPLLNLQSAAILLYNKEKDTFTVAKETGCGCKDQTLENNKKWDFDSVFQSDIPVVVEDFKNEKRFQIFPSIPNNEVESSVFIALKGSDELFGIMAGYRKEKSPFTVEELHFLQVAANIVGRTIEQHSNLEKVEEANNQLQIEIERSEQLQREIINNSVHERWELGGYLHDNFGQLLAIVKILVNDIQYKTSKNGSDFLKEVKEINTIMDTCIKSIRNVTHEIIPVDIKNEGVVTAFRVIMKQTSRLYNTKCKLNIKNKILDEIKNSEAATHLYHIVQEACKNAAIHGKTDSIVVSIDIGEDNLILQIKDEGIGFKATKNGIGKGIRIMKYRMDSLGGTFNISDYSDEKASGTVVTCTAPLEILKRADVLS